MRSINNRFYRNKRDGKFLGICSGLADYTGVEAVWWRVGAVVATFATFPIIPFVYLVTAMVSEKRPNELYRDYRDPETEKFERQTRRAPQRSIRDVHSRFRALDRRLSDIERGVTTQNTGLAREIDAL